jgi:hypothetical protein
MKSLGVYVKACYTTLGFLTQVWCPVKSELSETNQFLSSEALSLHSALGEILPLGLGRSSVHPEWTLTPLRKARHYFIALPSAFLLGPPQKMFDPQK